ncbi:MAG: TetR family transcriptional regulator [Reyranella sp.]|nr:TetR family transcriptional regulator [Reyranella sp.]
MTKSSEQNAPPEGLRERKRRETLQRITDAGMRLFIEKGYEATTLDEITAEAGISRRTFFYYFKSKDDILLSLQNGIGDMIVGALQLVPRDKRPLDALRDAIVTVCAAVPADDMIAIDRLMRSSEAVQARKQASYIQHERAVFAALRERWPEPERETGLRLVAMLAIGAMRLACDVLSREDGKRPLPELLHEAFDALENEI